MVDWLSVLDWNSGDLADLRFVGYSYIKQGKYATAVIFFQALVVLSSEAAYDLQTLGALHLQLGNSRSALHYLEKAIRKDPSHPPTQLNHAKALLAVGQRKQGLRRARSLLQQSDRHIAGQAEALLLAHSSE